jgi:hypothetical protein
MASHPSRLVTDQTVGVAGEGRGAGTARASPAAWIETKSDAYVSTCAVCAGGGEVIKIPLS